MTQEGSLVNKHYGFGGIKEQIKVGLNLAGKILTPLQLMI